VRERVQKRVRRTWLLGRTVSVVLVTILASFASTTHRAVAQTSAAAALAEGPTIEILNPLDQTGDSDPEPGPLVSDKATPANATYRLSAWAADAPVAAVVEFEIDTIPVTTITATRKVGTDTFEADWAIPGSVLDGPHQLDAALFSQVGGEEIARDSETITVLAGNPGQAANTVDIVTPSLNGALGFHKYAGVWSTILQAVTSSGTTFVHFLYSKSAPGTEPAWISCSKVKATAAVGGIRCDLKGDDQPEMVTAVGAVANDSPNPPQGAQYRAEFDRSTDAQRVFPYVQVPGFLTLTPHKQKMAAGDVGSTCSKMIVAKATDQFGRLIVGANIDVHAVGPGDNTRFGAGLFDDSDAAQPPDKGHSREELGADCLGINEFVGSQGEHNIAGAPDIKHIETQPSGTNAQGTFSFQLLADQRGTTDVTAWIDEDDNDEQEFAEATDVAAIGWGEAAGAAPYSAFLEPRSPIASSGDCVRFKLGVQHGGDPADNENVDVHIKGPDASTAFCDPPGASARRDPDAGAHEGASDPNGTLHAEGETGGDGRFIFGVTAAAREDIHIKAWVDTNDDDVLDGEAFDTAAVSFDPTGKRTITLHSKLRKAKPKARVTLRGRLRGEAACVRSRVVKLKARRAGTHKRFRTIDRTTTDELGRYGFVYKMGKRSKQFRADAPRANPCRKARSKPVVVRKA
jgi:hypothetical protein